MTNDCFFVYMLPCSFSIHFNIEASDYFKALYRPMNLSLPLTSLQISEIQTMVILFGFENSWGSPQSNLLNANLATSPVLYPRYLLLLLVMCSWFPTLMAAFPSYTFPLVSPTPTKSLQMHLPLITLAIGCS